MRAKVKTPKCDFRARKCCGWGKVAIYNQTNIIYIFMHNWKLIIQWSHNTFLQKCICSILWALSANYQSWHDISIGYWMLDLSYESDILKYNIRADAIRGAIELKILEKCMAPSKNMFFTILRHFVFIGRVLKCSERSNFCTYFPDKFIKENS